MSRRDRSPAATRRRLLTAGHEMFSRFAYSSVSGVKICEHAGVTRGALQHHFGSKLGLFMEVFETLQREARLRITKAIQREESAWDRARAGIAAYLDTCAQPAYQSVVLKEGPSAIGWKRWRELDSGQYADLVCALISLMAPTGMTDCAEAMQSAALRGTLTELALAIADYDDQDLARLEALIVVDKLLTSLRATVAQRSSATPTRIGIGQLRASASQYLERAAAGETIEVLRRGLVIASIQQPAN